MHRGDSRGHLDAWSQDENGRAVRLLVLFVVAILAAVGLRHITEDIVQSAVLAAPLLEELLKAFFVVALTVIVRMHAGLAETWPRELDRLSFYAVVFGVAFAGMEHALNYPMEPVTHLVLRLIAHPTYTLIWLAATLWLARMQRRWAWLAGIGAAMVVHGLYNASVLSALPEMYWAAVLAAALAIAIPSLWKARMWRRGPRIW